MAMIVYILMIKIFNFKIQLFFMWLKQMIIFLRKTYNKQFYDLL